MTEKFQAPVGDIKWVITDIRDNVQCYVEAHTAYDACKKASKSLKRDMSLGNSWVSVEQFRSSGKPMTEPSVNM